MNIIDSCIHSAAALFRHHLQDISIGLAATLLIIYGNAINDFFKRQTISLHFAIRFALFVLLCSVGYAFMTTQLVKIIFNLLSGWNDGHMVLAIVLSFLTLAFLARNGKAV